MIQKITPRLWFDTQAEEAVRLAIAARRKAAGGGT